MTYFRRKYVIDLMKYVYISVNYNMQHFINSTFATWMFFRLSLAVVLFNLQLFYEMVYELVLFFCIWPWYFCFTFIWPSPHSLISSPSFSLYSNAFLMRKVQLTYKVVFYPERTARFLVSSVWARWIKTTKIIENRNENLLLCKL